MWSTGFERLGHDLYEYAERLISHLDRLEYTRIILTQFEDWKPEAFHDEIGLTPYICQWEEYGYGWCREMFDNDEQFIDNEGHTWVEGGEHSEIVLIDEWMHNLRGHTVSICGAFDGECIEDLEIALEGANVPFKRINDLII